MAYCHNCGARLLEDSVFCPKCGTKVVKGVEASATEPSDEMREAFTRMSKELEKAFSIAAKQIQEAFQTAKENMQREYSKEPVTCPSCGQKNPSHATYCYNCGTKLKSKAEPTATK